MAGRLSASSLVLVLVMVIGGCDAGTASGGPSGQPPSAPLPTAVPTLAPAATTPPAPASVVEVIPPNAEAPSDGVGLAWARVHSGDAHGTAIAQGPAGWLYVAMRDGGGAPVIPSLHQSDDLRAWAELRPDAEVVAGGDLALAASRSAYVLPNERVVWWSADGRHWQQGTVTGTASTDIDVTAAVSDGLGFVAWRSGSVDGIWASGDGRAWTKISLPGAAAVIVDAVAAQPGGGFVLAGRAGTSVAELDRVEGPAAFLAARPGTQAVWTSADGFAWTPVPLGAGFDAVRFLSIAAGGPGGGIVAVGPGLASCGPGTAAPVCGTSVTGDLGIEPDLGVWRWTEQDGWQRLRGQGFPVVERDAGETRILATDSRWLLVGTRLRADAAFVLDTTSPGVVAGSEDGTRWWSVGTRLLAAGSPYYGVEIGVSGARVAFLVNWSGPGVADDHVEVWVSPPLDAD